MLNIIQSILTENDCYKSGRKLETVKGLMLHSVGCNQPNASVFVKNWNRSGVGACVHAFIDGLNNDTYQTLPWNWRGWHAGGAANNSYIGVEMCEPDCIKYIRGSTFSCSNKARAIEIATRTYYKAVELFAFLCEEYHLDPLGKNVIIAHVEGNKLGIASAHADPSHMWKQLGMKFTMDTFRADVAAKLKEMQNGNDDTPGTVNDDLYRIQTGAFKVKENAERHLAAIRNNGFTDAFIKKVGDYYKIQLGAFSKKENAEAMLNEVNKYSYDAFIVHSEKHDTRVEPEEPVESVEEIARRVLRGDFGNGAERRRQLEKMGYDPDEVQRVVNKLL